MERKLHPVQQRYFDTKARLDAIDVELKPIQQARSSAHNKAVTAQEDLIKWFKESFPHAWLNMCNATILEVAPYIDASTVPPDESEANE